MAFHDDYARLTPFELAFPDAEAARTLMAEVQEEAEARESDVGNPGAFVMLGTVGAFLRELQGPDADGDAIHEYAALVFHAYHFLRAGSPVRVLGTHVARYLVDGAVGDERPVLPSPAGYVQFPRHLFWLHAEEGAPAEAVDGLFWSCAGPVLHVLLAVGVREGRPGLSVVPLPDAPVADMPLWPTEVIRPEGDDFATTLPGGELDGLYSFVSAGEVFKLLARLFVYLRRFPSAELEGEAGDAEGTPAPSRLPFTRIVLHA